MKQVIKDVLIVCMWISIGSVTLWGMDLFGLIVSTSNVSNSSSLQVDFPKVHQFWKRGDAVFVDARSASNYRQGHIPGAVNLPINRVKHYLNVLPTDKSMLLITYCGSIECPNAYQLMNVLIGYGYQNVKFFPRGVQGWQALGHTLETE